MTRRFEISKGLDIPLSGEPRQTIEQSPPVRHYAILGDDYIGMKPTMEVAEGDEVRKGQLLFTDKKTPGVKFTSPVPGKVVAVNRGAKRKFESVVIEESGDLEYVFNSYPDANLAQLPREQVVDNLVNSGLWTALRTRPYSKVPAIDSAPAAVFVTAIDTNPLAADPAVVLADLQADFIAGLEALSVLTTGPTYLCKADGADLPGEDLACVETVEFSGPHPAGLVGTHIHMLMPAHMERTVWHIGYQDVAAVGSLMRTGVLKTDRVIALAGPATSDPRLVRTTLGANLTELTDGELKLAADEKARVVSGSALSGRTSESPRDFLGRYHTQVSLLVEGSEREFIGWMLPGADKFTVTRAYLGGWIAKFLTPDRGFAITTSTGGSHRAIVPTGAYESVMPLDIVPTPLLKSLAVSDSESANSLGALELDEEDLALCTFVCTSKNNYGTLLRECLTTIEREG